MPDDMAVVGVVVAGSWLVPVCVVIMVERCLLTGLASLCWSVRVQVRERWTCQLNPSRKNKEVAPWTPEEDRILFEARERLGNR